MPDENDLTFREVFDLLRPVYRRFEDRRKTIR